MDLDSAHLEILNELVDCVKAMGAYREDAVVTGGLVPLLYRFDSRFRSPRQPPLITGDMDFTVPEELPIRGDARLVDVLEAGGFVVIPGRGARPDLPAKHFIQHKRHGKERRAPIHGEFLIPLTGSDTDRDGKPKSPREIQSGLNAEALRYLDLLLWRPDTFDLSSIGALDLREEALEVRIPKATTYVIQKALCSQKRKDAPKADKDLVYIYDVATLTHGRWDEFAEEVDAMCDEKATWRKWTDRACDILNGAFKDDDARGPTAAEKMYGESVAKAKSVERVMSRFLEEAGLSK